MTKRLNVIYTYTHDYRWDGCDWYRVFMPSYYLAKLFKDRMDVTLSDSLIPADMEERDVFVFSRQCKRDVLEYITELKAKYPQKKVVLDIDDNLFQISYTNPARHQYTQEQLSILREFIKQVDLLTFTHDYLAKQVLTQVNVRKPYITFNNAIDTSYAMLHPSNVNVIKVMWAGGPTHTLDVSIIKDLLPAVVKKCHRKVLFITVGPRREWIETNFNLHNVEWTHYDWLPVEDYHRLIRSINPHIGLAPLLDTTFNRCKSSIKLVEYVYSGAVPVASDVFPYNQTFTGLPLAKKYPDWQKLLVRLINDDEYRLSLHQKLSVELKDRYDAVKVFTEFGNKFISIVSK